MLARACNTHKRQHARNIFLTVHTMGVVDKIKVGQEGPSYNHIDFPTSTCTRTAAKNIKRASVLDPTTQATDIQSKKFKIQTPLI